MAFDLATDWLTKKIKHHNHGALFFCFPSYEESHLSFLRSKKIMGNNASALLVLFLALREIVSRFPYGIVFACFFGIGFANSTKGRSVLAQELLGEFSAKSFSSQAPSRTLPLYQFICAESHLSFLRSKKLWAIMRQHYWFYFSQGEK